MSLSVAAASLDELWPDPDRLDAALVRCLEDVYRYEPNEAATPTELRVLEAMSHGLGQRGAADALGLGFESVKTHLKMVRRGLRAKDTTHAVAIALRRGLIL